MENKIFNSFTLKVIAMAAMLTDHIGALFFPQYLVLRMIGRLAFPIYCFLLVEGFMHTGNLKRYLLRLFVFALLSEVPFDLAFHNSFFYPQKQNVFWTLFFGLLLLALCRRFINPYVQMVLISLTAAFVYVIHTDYSYMGIVMILLFRICYIQRGKEDLQLETRLMQITSISILNAATFSKVQWMGSFALLPIQLYNGRRGPKHYQYLCYGFYPVHLLLLYFIKQG